MDLKALRDQAISEANNEFSEEKVESFKSEIKNIIRCISNNNSRISVLQEENEVFKKDLANLELKEFENITIS
jgi:hypothetical protein